MANQSKKESEVTIRIDNELKSETEMLLASMGLTFSEAVNLLAREIVMERKIPFEIKADPFYAKANQEVLQQSLAEYQAHNKSIY